MTRPPPVRDRRQTIREGDRPALLAKRHGRPVTPPFVESSSSKRWTRSRALFVATRPRQWIKNVLVFAAPGTAGLLGHTHVLERTAMTFGVFLVASAGAYLFNDSIDAAADRLHPQKSARPIASGDLSARLATSLGVGLMAGSIALAGLLAGWELAAVLGSYVLINIAYSLALKRIPVIEFACVASGFVLRAVAGGVSVHVPISAWFLIVTSSAALLVVAGKRSAEIELHERTGVLHRDVLSSYTPSYLHSVRLVASSITIMSFCLWAFQRASEMDVLPGDASRIFFELAIVPYVLGVLCVERSMEKGEGGAPEDLVLHSALLQVLGVCCLLLVSLGIYT
ncbi:MAG: decaprenyl-phosphate phosphoribosyltransferase [Acidimicrobiales bacterium]